MHIHDALRCLYPVAADRGEPGVKERVFSVLTCMSQSHDDSQDKTTHKHDCQNARWPGMIICNPGDQ